MTDLAGLADFLLARVAEDEAVAEAATTLGHGWEPEGPHEVYANGDDPHTGVLIAADCPENDAAHITRWNPDRVLAECQVKRRLIFDHDRDHECSSRMFHEPPYIGCEVLRTLALPYADHESYRQEWRP